MFETYTAPQFEDSDVYKAQDNYGRVIIVKVRERKESIVTDNSPDGAPGVIVDLVDLGQQKKYKNVLWMNGAVVDGLSQYVGRGPVVIKFEQKNGKNGRKYPAPREASPDEVKAAQEYVNQHGDPFVPQLSTTAAAGSDGGTSEPPF